MDAKKTAKKALSTHESYLKMLNSLLNQYFTDYSEDLVVNELAFDILDKCWKKWVYQANKTNTEFVMDKNAFGANILAITSREDFKDQLEKSKITK